MRAEYLFQPLGAIKGDGPRSRSIGLRNTLGKGTNTYLTLRGEICPCFVSSPMSHVHKDRKDITMCGAQTATQNDAQLRQYCIPSHQILSQQDSPVPRGVVRGA